MFPSGNLGCGMQEVARGFMLGFLVLFYRKVREEPRQERKAGKHTNFETEPLLKFFLRVSVTPRWIMMLGSFGGFHVYRYCRRSWTYHSH